MPVIVLLGMSMLLLELSLHHEVVAMRAAGLGLRRMLPPLFAVALVAAIFAFCLQAWVTPQTNRRLDEMERVYVHHKAKSHSGVQWIRDGQRMWKLRPLDGRSFSLMVLEVDEQGRWLRRLDARRAHYQAGVWRMEDVHISCPDAQTGMSLEHRSRMSLASSVGPDASEPPRPGHMYLPDLVRYVRLLADAGMRNSSYLYALHHKFSAPLGCLVMVLLAAALCMNMGSRLAGRSLGVGVTIALGLSFYALGNVTAILATSERLPAVFAAWMPFSFFAGLGGFLLMHREQL